MSANFSPKTLENILRLDKHCQYASRSLQHNEKFYDFSLKSLNFKTRGIRKKGKFMQNSKQTITEKIFSEHVGREVFAGDVLPDVEFRPV